MSSKSSQGGQGVERLLKISPVASVMNAGPVELPPARAPSLAGLEVRVPRPEDLTQEDLIVRFHEKKRAVASVRERALGEPVALGDDVQLDTVGYAAGKLIPFSARFGVWMELAPIEALPGFAEGVAEGTVGGSVQLQLELPEDYPVESLRGQPVRFIVDIRAAREVTPPDDSSPELLKKLGMGSSLDEVMQNIREELEDELADQLWVQGRDMVLEEVARRAAPEVPRSLVDEEIRRRWAEAEGRAMVERDFDVEEQQEALQAWLTDPSTREEAERRLHLGLALKAVVEEAKLTLTPEKLEELLTGQVEPFGLTRADVKQALGESQKTARHLHDLAWHLLAVEYVMSKAKVIFEGAEEA
ncbi:MAG TPA: peptidylprolyl isomerase [Myxococcaceae bacterium]|nr:peptidylprolyl isomerase [Myxococcaceae bacterium]